MEARLSVSNEALEEEREGRRDDVEGLQMALRDERSVPYRLGFVVVLSALWFVACAARGRGAFRARREYVSLLSVRRAVLLFLCRSWCLLKVHLVRMSMCFLLLPFLDFLFLILL